MVAVPFVRIGGGWGELNGKKSTLSTDDVNVHKLIQYSPSISDFVSDYDRSLIAPTYRSQTDVGGVHN